MVTWQVDAGARIPGQDRASGTLRGWEWVLGGGTQAGDGPGCCSVGGMGCRERGEPTVESNLFGRQEANRRNKFPRQPQGFTGALGWRCEEQEGDGAAADAKVWETPTQGPPGNTV